MERPTRSEFVPFKQGEEVPRFNPSGLLRFIKENPFKTVLLGTGVAGSILLVLGENNMGWGLVGATVVAGPPALFGDEMVSGPY